VSIHSDEVLAQRASRSDGAALIELAFRHWPGLHRLARHLSVDADASAIAEEAFGRALGGCRLADVPFRISLYRQAIALASTHGRSLPAGEAHRLDRACLLLRDVEDFSAEEAAFILRTSPAIIRKRAHRARLMLAGSFALFAGTQAPFCLAVA